MPAQKYTIEIDGYWREPNKSSLPNKSGIYCVYAGTYQAGKGTVTLNKLIYIGESEAVRDRVVGHEKLTDWKKHLRPGQCLTYSFGPTPKSTRCRCEAAMIFKHKPPTNTEFVSSFPFDTTTIALSGEIAKLQASFTVRRT